MEQGQRMNLEKGMQQMEVYPAWQIQLGEGGTGAQLTAVAPGSPHLNTHACVPGHNTFIVSRMKSNLP